MVLAGGVAQAQPAQGTADDDLAVVKRAVEKDESADTASPPPVREARRPHRLDQPLVEIKDVDSTLRIWID